MIIDYSIKSFRRLIIPDEHRAKATQLLYENNGIVVSELEELAEYAETIDEYDDDPNYAFSFDDDGSTIYSEDSEWELNPNQKLVENIMKAIERNDGYCPCNQEGADKADTLCPCKAMREGIKCCCNLYIKND